MLFNIGITEDQHKLDAISFRKKYTNSPGKHWKHPIECKVFFRMKFPKPTCYAAEMNHDTQLMDSDTCNPDICHPSNSPRACLGWQRQKNQRYP